MMGETGSCGVAASRDKRISSQSQGKTSAVSPVVGGDGLRECAAAERRGVGDGQVAAKARGRTINDGRLGGLPHAAVRLPPRLRYAVPIRSRSRGSELLGDVVLVSSLPAPRGAVTGRPCDQRAEGAIHAPPTSSMAAPPMRGTPGRAPGRRGAKMQAGQAPRGVGIALVADCLAATRANGRRCRCLDPDCFLIGSLRQIDVIAATLIGSERDHGPVPR
jgi:hypothetical protein